MKLTVLLLAAAQCSAFVPAIRSSFTTSTLSLATQTDTKKREGGVADELGLPCEGECRISSYPNLPESVHPGVLSGKALLDLLQDAKTKGKLRACPCSVTSSLPVLDRCRWSPSVDPDVPSWNNVFLSHVFLHRIRNSSC